MTSRGMVAVVVLAGCLLPGCSGIGCNKGFDYSLAADAKGPATPRDALDDWLGGDDREGAPASGWRRLDTSPSSGVVFRSGHWEVGVAKAPAGGYLVVGGSCSTDR